MHPINETICAIATPPGMGGIGVIRLSGPESFNIASLIFKGTLPLGKDRTMQYGRFCDPSTGEILDKGLLLTMPGPKSYTAEDIVEFHAHGSPSLLSRIIDVLTANGAKPAHPGEFTYRAFLNGRLDLSQAEAVQMLVAAQGDASRREAIRQLTGGLAVYLEPIEASLKDLCLQVEARIEFPEDGLPSLDRDAFEKRVIETGEALVGLAESYQQGRILSEGLKVALVGAPNAGKSSLLNALLGREKAIVTPHPGTTRDVVEGEFLFKGVHVRLFDTAGIREVGHEIEAEGIRRSRQIIEEADIVLWLLEATDPSTGIREAEKARLPEQRTWYLFNKVDLLLNPDSWKSEMGLLPDGKTYPISCKTGEGLDEVAEVFESAISASLPGEDVVLLSARHRREIEKAAHCLARLGSLMQSGQPFELWAEEIKQATMAIGRIRGKDLPEAAFQEIFQEFCVGK